MFIKSKLLRIFISETEKYEGISLYEWIIKKANSEGLNGATVLRGLEGYGRHHIVHTLKVLSLSFDQPVVIEIIDDENKIKNFYTLLEIVVKEGVATINDVEVNYFGVKQ